MNWSATASRLKTYPCCNRHHAHQHAHFASSGTGLHIGRYPLSILSILIIRSIFQSPNQCLSIWPVALQLESCSTFCPSTRFDCIIVAQSHLFVWIYWIPHASGLIGFCVLLAEAMRRSYHHVYCLQTLVQKISSLLIFIRWPCAYSIFLISRSHVFATLESLLI
jgi:hypothetical protein